ncbi:malectin domain-containing carbohydrate-binding protein [Hymenobacter volaticus]|uniref:Malectin domain-containing carbohydrate-binding protein n=1 Tax=Hymenobacter volaticus TaxID=2932254 RepID=A0ABY4GFP5_9BACT|nr:malectin domain-containing carbohydrate-binding protein [Hymenobacter volaticus]UOQ69144.1 malectin domain-containing carbohydrate-binding protein [Hymenobacter volaticus]
MRAVLFRRPTGGVFFFSISSYETNHYPIAALGRKLAAGCVQLPGASHPLAPRTAGASDEATIVKNRSPTGPRQRQIQPPRRAQARRQAGATVAPGLEWVARYAGPGSPQNKVDVATALVVDAAGNVYVTGRAREENALQANDYATIKYSPSGQQLWVARYNNGGDDVPMDLAVDAAGNVYVTGRSFNQGSGDDYATVKYSASGQRLWTARYNGAGNGSDQAVGLGLDAAGNVYVTGTSAGTGTKLDYVTVKYAPGGQRLWEARYNAAGGNDEAVDIALDAAGNILVTGTISRDSDSVSKDYATLKYTASGEQLWVNRYNGSGNANDLAVALAVDAAGNVVVTGTSSTTTYFTDDYPDYATVKYAANGQQLWDVRYNGVLTRSLEQAFDVAVDAAGDVFVTGRSRNPTKGDWDYATLKYAAASGQQLWEARYDGGTGESEDDVTAMAVNAAGDVYVTGASNGDYGTLKYAGANGQQLWALYYTQSSSSDAAYAVAIDAADNVYVTGASGGGPSDFATLKYGINTVNQVPTARAAPTTPLTLPTTSTRLSGAGTDPDGTIVGYIWSQVSGPSPAVITGRSGRTPLVSNLVAGTYVFSLEVTDSGGLRSAASQTTLTVNPEPADGRVLYRVNAGGSQVTNAIGTFAADPFNADGATFATDQPIAGTEDDALYQSERYGRYFRYSFAVSRGKQYEVVLHFAEVYATRAGQRVFDVAAEGLVALNDYDIYQKVGPSRRPPNGCSSRPPTRSLPWTSTA